MTTLAATNSLPLSATQTAPAPRPIRWRLALLTGIAVYPVITFLLYVIVPLTEGWATWQRTLVLVPLMVSSIVYAIAPQLQRRFGKFLTGRK